MVPGVIYNWSHCNSQWGPLYFTRCLIEIYNGRPVLIKDSRNNIDWSPNVVWSYLVSYGPSQVATRNPIGPPVAHGPLRPPSNQKRKERDGRKMVWITAMWLDRRSNYVGIMLTWESLDNYEKSWNRTRLIMFA